MSKSAKKSSQTAKWVLIGGIVAIVIVVLLFVIFSGSGKTTISVETSLKEVIEVSQLNTAAYTYNSIVEVKDGDKTKYYVAYEGTVRTGVNFADVEIRRNGEAIQIVIPDVEISDAVEVDNMEYIFVKKKYDTETTFAEASKACKEDLRQKASANVTLRETARKSAEDTLMALVKPFEAQLNEGEFFEIVFNAEQEVGQ